MTKLEIAKQKIRGFINKEGIMPLSLGELMLNPSKYMTEDQCQYITSIIEEMDDIRKVESDERKRSAVKAIRKILNRELKTKNNKSYSMIFSDIEYRITLVRLALQETERIEEEALKLIK